MKLSILAYVDNGRTVVEPRLARVFGAVVMVTHNSDLAAEANRVIRMKDGKVQESVLKSGTP
jgi:ABC-type lipoprotein export system ATPase subunit